MHKIVKQSIGPHRVYIAIGIEANTKNGDHYLQFYCMNIVCKEGGIL